MDGSADLQIKLPAGNGRMENYRLHGPRQLVTATSPAQLTRVAYSAAHVVADPLAAINPSLDCAVDWDATIAYRQYLWRMGVAEAMDTAQRGMGMDWPQSLELIRRSTDAARDIPGALLASGCGTDQLAPEDARSIDDVIRAYEEQMAAIEAVGGRLILMASRALARVAHGPADYEKVYDRVLRQASGDVHHPSAAGRGGSRSAVAGQQDGCPRQGHLIGGAAGCGGACRGNRPHAGRRQNHRYHAQTRYGNARRQGALSAKCKVQN